MPGATLTIIILAYGMSSPGCPSGNAAFSSLSLASNDSCPLLEDELQVKPESCETQHGVESFGRGTLVLRQGITQASTKGEYRILFAKADSMRKGGWANSIALRQPLAPSNTRMSQLSNPQHLF